MFTGSFASACARPRLTTSPIGSVPGESPRPGVSDANFTALLARFAENDRRHGWTSAECQHVGRGFADVRALVLLAALELERARELAPLRPDVDYNRALFALARVRTLTGVDDARALEEARTAFERFVHKADGAPQYASDVAQAQEHLADLRDTLRFVHPESQ